MKEPSGQYNRARSPLRHSLTSGRPQTVSVVSIAFTFLNCAAALGVI
jgi:hypothetical protein